MKRAAFLVGLSWSLFAGASEAGESVGPTVIPRPARVEPRAGSFALTRETRIVVEKGSPDAMQAGRHLADFLQRATGAAAEVSENDGSEAAQGAILLTRRGAKAEWGGEGYELAVNPESVVIRAPGAAGLFYGVQTLRQLLPPEAESPAPGAAAATWRVACARIEDAPRFAWRGLLVDTARHFFPKEVLKEFIDLMALHKFNVLQIHFTDDQSWTLQIDAYPKLTTVGARGGPYAINGRWLGLGKGIGSGRFHSKDDIRELVRYARERNVTIVPEIEMPAHAASWLAAYPELLCTSRAVQPAPEVGQGSLATTNAVYGAHRELCPGNDATYAMVEGVLGEVMELFPAGPIHVGGDEATKQGWKSCERCQARMKALGLKDEKELQSYFIKRVGKFIESKGRKFVGWDEIMEGGLAPNAIVMSWRGVKPGQAAVAAGHDVVFSPTSHCYFDYPYDRISTEKVYSFEPGEGLAAEQLKHLKGVQGNLWSEYIPDRDRLQFMAYPRACALAEVAWSPKEQRSWADFQQRLATHLKRLEGLKVNYNRESAAAAKSTGAPTR